MRWIPYYGNKIEHPNDQSQILTLSGAICIILTKPAGRPEYIADLIIELEASRIKKSFINKAPDLTGLSPNGCWYKMREWAIHRAQEYLGELSGAIAGIEDQLAEADTIAVTRG